MSTGLLLEKIQWPELLRGRMDGVSVLVQWCGRDGVCREPSLAVVAPDVNTFCYLRLKSGEHEIRSPSRACDFSVSEENQPALLITVTPDGDIRAELVLPDGRSERFFFENGMRLFRSAELISAN